jgi:hypothetical protein
MTAHRFGFLSPWFAAAASFLAAVSSAMALTIRADLDGGAGSSGVDQYPGAAGVGWAAAWSTAGTIAAAVAADGPLDGGGNFVRLTASAVGDVGAGRAYIVSNETMGVAPDKALVHRFTCRLDSTTTGFDSTTDYLTFAANTGGAVFTSSTATSVLIRAYGASPAAGKNGMEWLAYNGGRNSGTFDTSLWVNTGMPLVPGRVYDFIVEIDPLSRTYSVTISDGTSSTTTPNLGFRTSSTTAPNTFSTVIRKSAAGDVLAFSLDQLSIEPRAPDTYAPAGTALPYVIDMVLDNPGEAATISRFNDPAFLRDAGFKGKGFSLFDSGTLAVNWDSINPEILPVGSPDRAWVEAKAASITARYQAMKDAGLQVYCMSDLVLLPKRLVSLYGLSSTFGNVQNANTEYFLRAQLRLMFEQFPALDGVIVRIGETYLQDAPYHQGKIDNPTNASLTIIPLMNILRDEVCVKLNKKVFFRTWYSFDVNATTFSAVSDAVAPHANLIWSIKHCEGDFHRGNNFSKVLGLGRHPFIVEVQAAREYEGKGAYPNYISNGVIEGFEEHLTRLDPRAIRGIRELYQRSPLMSGVWTWSRGGGWEGPYIQDELWCELNAWVMAQWALNPGASEATLFDRFATERLGLPAGQLADFRRLALLSAEAVLRWKRGVDIGLDPWWTRDQYFTFPTLPSGSAAVQSVLDSQDEAVSRYEEIVDIAARLTPSDSDRSKTIRSSSEYGLILARLLRAVVNLTAIGSAGDPWLIKYWTTQYDAAFADYAGLAARYPGSVATFYVEPARRTSAGENPTTALPRFRTAVSGLPANPALFSQWAKANAGPAWDDPAVGGPTASLQADGIPNLLRYAMRLAPQVRQAAPVVEMVTEGHVALDVPRNPHASDATITLRESDDLVTWRNVASSVNGAPFSLIDPARWAVSEAGAADAPTATFVRTPPESARTFWSVSVSSP